MSVHVAHGVVPFQSTCLTLKCLSTGKIGKIIGITAQQVLGYHISQSHITSLSYHSYIYSAPITKRT